MILDNITWLGHASFKISGAGKLIYIDPWEIKQPEEADLIFITHSHYDHLSREDLIQLTSSKTTLVAPPDCKDEIPGISNFISVVPGEEREVEGIRFKVIPAYNINKQFHPKSRGWVGYIIEIEGEKIYHPGDTDLIPEMDDLEVDIALLPIGGTYTMDAKEAAEAAKRVKAKVVVPMHYGKIVGSSKDVETLRAKLPAETQLMVFQVK